MVPTATNRRGRSYTYYRCLRDSKRAVSLCPIRQIAAPVIEGAVQEQLSAIFRTPDVAIALASMNGIAPAAVTEAFDGDFWKEATRGEQRRLIELLVASIHLHQDKLEIEIRTEGVRSIMEEIEHEADND